jgi:flagellar biosynthesis/type III secretory pathway ATPase
VGNDALLDEAIARHTELTGFVAQRPDALVNLAHSRAALIEGFGR